MIDGNYIYPKSLKYICLYFSKVLHIFIITKTKGFKLLLSIVYNKKNKKNIYMYKCTCHLLFSLHNCYLEELPSSKSSGDITTKLFIYHQY